MTAAERERLALLAEECGEVVKAIGKTPADIAGRVIRCGPRNVGVLFERDPNTGRVVPTPALAALEQLLADTGASVLVCDPLAELHNAEENDNTAMRSIIASICPASLAGCCSTAVSGTCATALIPRSLTEFWRVRDTLRRRTGRS